MIPLDDVRLLLLGWHEDSRRLRVSFETPVDRIVATCKIYKIEGDTIAFHIGGDNYFELSLSKCIFDFTDPDPSECDLPIGETVESAILGARPSENLFILLLRG